MTSSIKCFRCDGEMQEGFILDATDGPQLVARWVAGKPEKSRWTGTKLKGKEQHLIHSFRCIRCGYLESYAPEM